MCEPTTIAVIGLAVSAAASAVSYQQQENAADAQENFQRRRYEETAANAEASFLAQAAQNNLRIQQEAEAAAQEIQHVKKTQAQARSAAVVSAGEAGVTGLSIDALLADFDRTAATRNEAIRRNFEFTAQQIGVSGQGLAAQAQNRKNGAVGGPIARPNAIGTGLQIGGAALDSYDYYRRNTATDHLGQGNDTDPGDEF